MNDVTKRKSKCNNCIHQDVCVFKREFIKAQEAIDSLIVNLGENSSKHLRDFSYVEPVRLKCIFFLDKNQSLNRGNFEDIN